MKIIVGSKNPTKVQAVYDIFKTDEIDSYDVPSHVSSQPFSDEETMQGAINRATECLKIDENAIGIGLEGGLMKLENELYLCNWGALVTPDYCTYTAGGARIRLPKEISDHLHENIELGEIMDEYAKKKGVSKHEGAIGILTKNHMLRKEMFVHIVQLLRGQWKYHQ